MDPDYFDVFVFGRIAAKAGHPVVRLNDLRHFFADIDRRKEKTDWLQVGSKTPKTRERAGSRTPPANSMSRAVSGRPKPLDV
jgi:hypothetical protein